MGYTAAQANEFIRMIAPLMQSEAKKRGYNVVSTAIAQAIIEGACNTSALAKNYHNHFGLKCGKAWLNAGKPSVNMKTKEEYTPGKLSTINDYFRVYPNGDAEGVAGYYDFISASRYANLKTATNYREYAERLKLDGYATSSSYVNTLCNTVLRYNLMQYDQVSTKVYPTLRKGDKNDYVKHVQIYLSALGYPVGNIDSTYGECTMNAVKEYQQAKKLKVDGIWGQECWKSVNG